MRRSYLVSQSHSNLNYLGLKHSYPSRNVGLCQYSLKGLDQPKFLSLIFIINLHDQSTTTTKHALKIKMHKSLKFCVA